MTPSNEETPPTPPKPMRLQRFLAQCGLGSRRDCEELITSGRVAIDGKVADQLGTTVQPLIQEVSLDGERLKVERKKYFMLNKPSGYLCTANDPEGRRLVIDLFPSEGPRLFTVGRLDENTTGLILVTNDGDLAQKLAHPRYRIFRTYVAQVAGQPRPEVYEQLREGLFFTEGKFRVHSVKPIKKVKDSTWVEIVMTEGQNREIRRLFARVGHKIMKLERQGYGPLNLGRLNRGEYRELSRDELASLHAVLIRNRAEEGKPPARRPSRPTESRDGGDRARSPRRESEGRGFDRERRPRSGEGDRFERRDRPARSGGDRPSRGDRPDRGERSFGERSFGDRPNRGDRPARSGGDRPSRGDRPDRGERSFGERSFGDRPSRGDRPARSGGDRPNRGDRPERGERSFGERSFGDRPNRGDRPARSGGDRPSRGDRPDRGERSFGERSFGDRPNRGDRPARSGGDRPSRGGSDHPARGGDRPVRGERFERSDRPTRGDRPDRGERSFGDRPNRGDRPVRSGGERPTRGDRPERGERSFGDRPSRGGGDRPERRDRPDRGVAGERGGRTGSGRGKSSFSEGAPRERHVPGKPADRRPGSASGKRRPPGGGKRPGGRR